MLNNIIDCTLKGGNKNYLIFLKIQFSGCLKPNPLHFCLKNPLQGTVQHFVKCSSFEVGNLTLLQTIGIPIGIDEAPF